MPPWECDNCHEEAKPVVLLRCPKCLWETEADEQEPPEQECSPCPLEGRVVALEARLHALELAIIADVAEIEKLKTLAEQGTDLFEEHDERLQALERPAAPEPAAVSLTGAVSTASPTLDQQQRDTRPAAPAQRQPGNTCSTCRFKEHMAEETCRSCRRSHWQPRQGAGL